MCNINPQWINTIEVAYKIQVSNIPMWYDMDRLPIFEVSVYHSYLIRGTTFNGEIAIERPL